MTLIKKSHFLRNKWIIFLNCPKTIKKKLKYFLLKMTNSNTIYSNCKTDLILKCLKLKKKNKNSLKKKKFITKKFKNSKTIKIKKINLKINSNNKENSIYKKNFLLMKFSKIKKILIKINFLIDQGKII